jgi:Chaperone of endosialidase
MSGGISPFSTGIVTEYLDDVYTAMTEIVTKQVVAFPDETHAPQSLFLGASCNLVLQSKQDLKVDLYAGAAFNIYTASGDTNTNITETQFFGVSLEPELGITQITTGSNTMALVPGDPNKTINIGSMTVNENSSSQLIDTSKFDIKMLKDLTVLGNFNLTGEFYTPFINTINMLVDNNVHTLNQVTAGNTFGNNMNIWINTPGSNDQETNRIGYGFYINSNTEQLEMFKYKRYSFVDSNGTLQTQGKTQYRKVAQFGYGVTSYDKETDVFETNVFDSLDSLTGISNLGTDIMGASGTAGATHWLMNSNANIYYFGNIGINQTQPRYALDVTGIISASDTIVSANYATASDSRIKTDVTQLNNAVCLDTIRKMDPCTYNVTTLNVRKAGFIAQEMRKIIPEAVDIKPNSALGIEDFHYLDYNAIISYLVGAVKELDSRVEELSTCLDAQQYPRLYCDRTKGPENRRNSCR